MIKKLLNDWNLRIKYVDDTSAAEIVPRNSISILDLTVRGIHQFSSSRIMKLNPRKCKGMDR
jgi:hypothetical protein